MLSSAELSRLWDTHAAALLLLAGGRCDRVAGTEAEECVQEASIRLATQNPVPNDPADPLHSIINQDAAGFAACLCDGSARFFSKTIDAATLKALLSINGGEVIDTSKLE